MGEQFEVQLSEGWQALIQTYLIFCYISNVLSLSIIHTHTYNPWSCHLAQVCFVHLM